MPLTTYKTSGTNNLEKAIEQLGKQAGFKVFTGALRDAAKPIIREARMLAPKKSGKLRKGIKGEVFKGTGKSDSVATIQIGFNRSTAWYGQILERGAKKHTIKPDPKKNKKALSLGANLVRGTVSHPGTRSVPMLRSSFDSKHKEALKILTTRLRERVILEAIKKYGKGA
jgi:HK97 gp10 family phage protein